MIIERPLSHERATQAWQEIGPKLGLSGPAVPLLENDDALLFGADRVPHVRGIRRELGFGVLLSDQRDPVRYQA